LSEFRSISAVAMVGTSGSTKSAEAVTGQGSTIGAVM
jgi:hypothetical protein